jgi:hypothetical protein
VTAPFLKSGEYLFAVAAALDGGAFAHAGDLTGSVVDLAQCTHRDHTSIEVAGVQVDVGGDTISFEAVGVECHDFVVVGCAVPADSEAHVVLSGFSRRVRR